MKAGKLRCNVGGACCIIVGVATMLSVGVMLPAFVNTFDFNTRLVETLVLDESDSLSDKPEWKGFLWGSRTKRRIDAAFQPHDRARHAKLHMFYVFIVGNGEFIMDRRTTAQKNPFVEQRGPYGYREFVEKYDVRFTNRGPDGTGSDLVTWKQWSYYAPLPVGDAACRVMDGRLEQKGVLPLCQDDGLEYTLVNRQFLQYVQEHTSAGVVGKLGHKLLAEVRSIFTAHDGPFLTNVRAWHLSPVLEEVAVLQGRQKIPEALNDIIVYRDAFVTLLPAAPLLPASVPFRPPFTLLNAHEVAAAALPPTLGRAVTVTAWVREDFDTSGYLFAKVVSAADARCCWCFSMNGYAADDDFRFEFGKGAAGAGAQRLFSQKWDLYDKYGAWHHVGLVVEESGGGQSTATFFVDGARFGASNIFPTADYADCAGGATYVGSRGPGFEDGVSKGRFRGDMADARLYPRALSDVEVGSIYKSPSSSEALGKAGRIFCGVDQNSDERLDCPFGAASHILGAAAALRPTPVHKWIPPEAALNVGQTNWLLNASTPSQLPAAAAAGSLPRPAAGFAGFMGPLETSFQYWINGSEHFRKETYGAAKDATNKAAFDTLVDVMEAWEIAGNSSGGGAYDTSRHEGGYAAAANGGVALRRRIAAAKVHGVMAFLFDPASGWVNERATKQKVARDWITQPLNTLSCAKHVFTPCAWEIEPFRYFLGVTKIPASAYADPVANPMPPTDVQLDMTLSVMQVRRLLDPALKDVDMGLGRGLSMSLLNPDSLPRVWGLAAHYCDAWRESRSMDCDGMAKAIEMGKDMLPRLLSSLDRMHQSIYSNNIWPKFKYEQQVCVIADYVGRNWLAGNNSWYEDRLAHAINLAFPEVWNASTPVAAGGNAPLTRQRLREVGYLQWGTGHYTRKKFGLNSVADIPDSGNDEGIPKSWPVGHRRIRWLSISDAEADREPLELGSIAYVNGFPAAATPDALPLRSAMVLLDELANASAYEMTHPVDTLCARLVRGATKLMIGSAINVTHMPQPDTYLRATNTWSSTALGTGLPAWRAQARAKGYSVTVALGGGAGSSSGGGGGGFASNATAEAAAQTAHAPLFSLDESVSTEWLPWADPDGLNDETGYSFPTEALRAMLEPAYVAPPGELSAVQLASAAAARAAARAAAAKFAALAAAPPGNNDVSGGHLNVTRDHGFLVSVMLSIPGCRQRDAETGAWGRAPADYAASRFYTKRCKPFGAGRIASAEEAANAQCCLWSSGTLREARLLPSTWVTHPSSSCFYNRFPQSFATLEAARRHCDELGPAECGGTYDPGCDGTGPFSVCRVGAFGGEAGSCTYTTAPESVFSACPDAWAFRNLLQLNASCAPAAHGVRVWLQRAPPAAVAAAAAAAAGPNGTAAMILNLTTVTQAEFDAAKAAFFEAAHAVDAANIATRAAAFPVHSSYGVQSSSALLAPLADLAAFDGARYGAASAVGTARLPFPRLTRPVRKRATILAGMVQSYVTQGFLMKRRIFCSADPKACDWRKGGMFTTQTVRNYLFDGYVDPLFSVLAADNFARHGWRYQCLPLRQIETRWNCAPVYDTACNNGFELSVADVQTVTTRADNYQYLNGGRFKLSFKGHATTTLSFDSTAAQVKAALELLPTIGEVRVTRFPETAKGRDAVSYSLARTHHGDYGFTWTVTFVTEKGAHPLLEVTDANFSTSFNVADWTGAGPQVWVRKLHEGVHPGANFSAVQFYTQATARYNGEWFRPALTVPDVRPGTPWAGGSPGGGGGGGGGGGNQSGCARSGNGTTCTGLTDVRPSIALSNPAFTARDLWFGDLWHGKLWRNARFQKERECARTDAGLKTIFYHYNARYENCEHTARTGRLDLRDAGDVVTFFGNHSIGWWDAALSAAQAAITPAPAPLGDVHSNAPPPAPVSAVVGRRNGDGPPAFRPFAIAGFLGNVGGTASTVRVFSRQENMAVLFHKVDRKWNLEGGDSFEYVHKRSEAELMDTTSLNGTVTIAQSRYCLDASSYHGLRRDATEPVGMLNLRPMSGSDLFVGPPHHMSVAQPWAGSTGTLDATVDGLYPQNSKHRSCIDVEPVTGTTLRYFWRTQWSYKVERDALFPNFVFGLVCAHRTLRCRLPGAGPARYAEPVYLPMFWRQEAYSIDPLDAEAIRKGVLAELERAYSLSTAGLVFGGGAFVLGLMCLWCTLGRRMCGCCRGERIVHAKQKVT